MIRLPEPDYRARFALMGYGLLIFIWMSLEDNGTLTVSLLGAGLATALILYQFLKLANGLTFEVQLFRFFIIFFMFGAFIGAVSTFATIFLMFFKTAWHGHEFPDYPLELMRDMFFRLPAWALAGGLISLGLTFIWSLTFPKELVRGEFHPVFPMTLAKHIAKALNLPSLYIGQFNGLEINYIWFITDADAWDFPYHSTIVVGTNKHLYATNYDWRLQESGNIVEIKDTEDEMVKLLRQHEHFSTDFNILDGSRVNIELVSTDEIRFDGISNPDSGGADSLQFLEIFSKMSESAGSNSKQNVIARGIPIRNYDGDFMRFLSMARLFGLTGLFGQAHEPHNLEYILELRFLYKAYRYVFVKTLSWFRAGKTIFASHIEGDIVNLPNIELNWQKLMKGQRIPSSEWDRDTIKIILYKNGKTITAELKQPAEADTSSPLWNALRPLIEQIKEA